MKALNRVRLALLLLPGRAAARASAEYDDFIATQGTAHLRMVSRSRVERAKAMAMVNGHLPI